jgi:hypothetical protein
MFLTLYAENDENLEEFGCGREKVGYQPVPQE